MNNQLSKILTQYRKFSKGQYVKHPQFNEFLDYFEDQDRLSRVMLFGVGILCGFRPKPTYVNNKVSGIQLSQGIAITTDGDLLTLSNESGRKAVKSDPYMSEPKSIDVSGKHYTHWKAYDNKAIYPQFHHASGDQIKQEELWELVTTAEARKGGFEAVTSFPGFEDKYLLLYLESYEKEAKPCAGVDCDNHGLQQVRNLKVLITTAAGIAKLLEADKVSPHPVSLNLSGEEKLRRVILSPVQQSAEGIRQLFKAAVADSDYQSMFANIDRICEMMGIAVAERPGFSAALQALSDKRENFQYSYGVLKDLTDTYAEIIRLLSKTFTKHLPDYGSFPKHIILGKLIPGTPSDTTRQRFYNSPVLGTEEGFYNRLMLLLDRFNLMATRFNDPSEAAAKKGVTIIPSQTISPLGSKAIPFYYNLNNALLDTWSFEKTVNRKSDTNLSYSTEVLSQDAHIQAPLGYDLGGKSFYRIEGHQGVDYAAAVNAIRQIKNDAQLSFDVMALSLAQLKDNKDLSKKYFTEYVEKHPGLEYLGGVRRGGTFAVIYESEENKAVLADFALPYICCTPKPDVALSLPVTVICENAPALVFKVTPANGVVEANVGAGLKGGVESINGQYIFNPQAVEDAYLDSEIHFTVNGKPTNCAVTVRALPAVTVAVKEFIYPEGGASVTSVVFNVSGTDFLKNDYQWDFEGNGRYIAIRPDAKGDVRHDYLKIDETKPVNIRIATNGCTQIKTLEKWYIPDKRPLEVTIIPSTLTPSNENLTLSSIVNGAAGNLTFQWESSSTKAILRTPNAAQTGVGFSAPGPYRFTLTVQDSASTAVAEITLTVA